jgi:hypothetical protein
MTHPTPTRNDQPAQRISVSDHAVVRWLERNNLVDVAQLRAQLAASLEKSCAAATQLHAHEYYVRRDGFRFVVNGGVLVTMYPEKSKTSRLKKRRHEEREV